MIYNKSCHDMSEVASESVHLIITSPPYNVGMEYENDLPLDDYLAFLNRVWQECKRVLCEGGRLCVNIASTGRQPYIPLHSYISINLLNLGFLMRGDILWNKGATGNAHASTAWGSWCSPSNPCLRDSHEYILVFSDKEFLEYTISIWDVPTESATRIGHPAPFPVDIPHRLIKLYSFENDVVLDPFMGSGTTAVAANRLKRRWMGYETDSNYVTLANGRLGQLELNIDY